MGKRIYIVRLSREERIGLQKLVKTGKVAAFKRHRAQILLNVDQGDHGPCLKNTDVARQLDTVSRPLNEPVRSSSKLVCPPVWSESHVNQHRAKWMEKERLS